MRLVWLLLLAACAPATPESPTWVSDVKQILDANCIRCHGSPAIGGAPATFRLDVFDDRDDGAGLMRGAQTLSAFIAARTAHRGDMPPRGAKLSGRQKDILDAWAKDPVRGERPGNSLPTVRVNELASNGDRELRFDVLVGDADGDVVSGSFLGVPLHTGRQTVVWDLAGVASGPHPLAASVDDGSGLVEIDLGTRTIPARANAAPGIVVETPRRDDLVRGGARVTVGYVIQDPDPSDLLSLDLEAVQGATTIPLVRGLAVGRSRGSGEVTMDVPDGVSWRVRARVTDGTAATVAESQPFVVSRATTAETYASVRPIVDAICAPCHNAIVAGDDYAKQSDLQTAAGRSWRKVVQLREMPPKSTSVVLPAAPPFTEDDRRRLGEWLLAGAP